MQWKAEFLIGFRTIDEFICSRFLYSGASLPSSGYIQILPTYLGPLKQAIGRCREPWRVTLSQKNAVEGTQWTCENFGKLHIF